MRSPSWILDRGLTLLGIVGGRMRARMLAFRGATVKQKVTIGPGCRVERPWCVTVGGRCKFEDGVYLKVVDDDAVLEFGVHVFVGRGSQFDVQERVFVGDHTLIAPGCFITDHSHGISGGLRIDQQPGVARPVVIGEDVWLGANVTVVQGVKIGDGAIVGANAVVTSDIPPMAVAVGVPAKVLRYRDNGAGR